MIGEKNSNQNNEGKQRTHRRCFLLVGVIAALVIVAAVIVLKSCSANGNGDIPSESESVIETSASVEESKPVTVVIPETESETETEEETEPVFEYVDAYGEKHETIINQNALMHDYVFPAIFQDGQGGEYEASIGIDVSHHQGSIDWSTVRSYGYSFAILRAAYRGYGDEGTLKIDDKFEDNYKGANNVGVRIGLYVYSQAINEEEARQEAQIVIDELDGREVDLFIAYDPEYVKDTHTRNDALTPDEITKNAIAFCETVKEAGYTPAIYSNMLWEAENFDMEELTKRYEFWYADYEMYPQTPYAFSTWQFTEEGKAEGIEGNVDLNYRFEKPREESEAEKKIYSYVQVPKKWYSHEEWIGDWTEIQAGGTDFVHFGCGLCCLSNMVCTLTDNKILPGEMYELTRQKTSYAPSGGHGAVSWGEMAKMCREFGLTADIKQKPDYDTFVSDVSDAAATTVVVCKDNDTKLWWYTGGHYVTLWDYDKDTDTVFVSDPSGLYNRKRVKLRYVYDALKTASDAQYMTVKNG